MIESILKGNFVLNCDSYKVSHKDQYPRNTEYLYSTIVPRKRSDFTGEIVAAGVSMLSMILANVRITREMIDEAEIEINEQGYDFDRKSWEFIVERNYGILPLVVCGVPEGTVIAPQTPVVAIMNTIPGFDWLVSYVETMAQRIVWKMTNVASVSRYLYKTIGKAMKETGADMSMMEYKLHNFGDRGADGYDAAIEAAISHGMLFSGSDCLSANRYIKAIYNTKKAYLSSIGATEHSTMCSWSDADARDDWQAAVMVVEQLEKAVERSKRGIGIPVQAGVIDTYDAERFVGEYIGVRLKDRILASGGTLVCRPDSGDPLVEPITRILQLKEAFGFSVTSKGYICLNPAVRVIQGDGINVYSIPRIIANVMEENLSMDNINFGMGGGLTHEGSRDLFSFSMKATARYADGKWIKMLKAPKTDMGKKSLTGLVYVKKADDGSLVVADGSDISHTERLNPAWIEYYKNGDRFVENYDVVRSRARA